MSRFYYCCQDETKTCSVSLFLALPPFLPSPLTSSSLEMFIFSFWLRFLCCRSKELLKCHELSGSLIFPVLSWKKPREQGRRGGGGSNPRYQRLHRGTSSFPDTFTWQHQSKCFVVAFIFFTFIERIYRLFFYYHSHALQLQAQISAAQCSYVRMKHDKAFQV